MSESTCTEGYPIGDPDALRTNDGPAFGRRSDRRSFLRMAAIGVAGAALLWTRPLVASASTNGNSCSCINIAGTTHYHCNNGSVVTCYGRCTTGS